MGLVDADGAWRGSSQRLRWNWVLGPHSRVREGLGLGGFVDEIAKVVGDGPP